VLHVASPLGDGNPKNPDDLIIPARDGAVRVLRAATVAGVKRVVLTSACAAASPSLYTEDSVTDETLWTDPDDPRLTTYRKSKTLAEKAAWDFMASYEGPTTLTTILPGAVFGPVLTPADGGSVQVIGRLLDGRMPGTPRLGFEIVDVRDLADVHIRAMTADAAGGQRFIAVGEFLWMSEIATTLRSNLGESARKVPTRKLPDLALKAMSLFDSSLRDITPALGRKHRHTAAKAEQLLGWHARPATETVINCAESLLTKNAL
jgi:nucleoside-diphosphate-sugar epimerase